jgi:hypothetical protein
VKNILILNGKVITPLFTATQAAKKDFVRGEDVQGPFVACQLNNQSFADLWGWYVLVSPEDLSLMTRYTWCGRISGSLHKAIAVRRRENIDGQEYDFWLNQEIWTRQTGREIERVWRLGHPLDFRRSNLSSAPLRKECRGVSFRHDLKSWQVQITVNGENKYLGLAAYADEGYRMYNRYLRQCKSDCPDDLNIQTQPYNNVSPMF